MSKQTILQKDSYKIESGVRDLQKELETMQDWLDWFTSLHYTEKITTLEAAKAFLTNTKGFHDAAVIKYLKTKTSELPPNLQPLRDSWNICDCDECNFSGNPRFERLQMTDGKLEYSQSVYDEIETKFTRVATEAEAAALSELDRLWYDLQKISEALYPTPGIQRRVWFESVTLPLSPLRHHRPGWSDNPSLLTPWTVEAIQLLANTGFGQSKKKSINQ